MRLVLATLLFVLVPFFVFGGWAEALAEDYVRADLQPCTLGTFLLATLAADSFLPLPSSVLAATAAARLGAAGAAIVIGLGTFSSAAICFLIGRAINRITEPAHINDVPKVTERQISNTALTVFLTRGVPVLAESTAILAGAVCPFKKFALSAAVSSMLLAMAYVLVSDVSFYWIEGDLLILFCSVFVPLVVTVVAVVARRWLGLNNPDGGRMQ